MGSRGSENKPKSIEKKVHTIATVLSADLEVQARDASGFLIAKEVQKRKKAKKQERKLKSC